MGDTHDELRALRLLLSRANDDRDRLLKVASAVLMFHRGGAWTLADRKEWTRLTGQVECTTASLCAFARQQMEALVAP